jgi:tetratricopeptide (TPR) repeat protein
VKREEAAVKTLRFAAAVAVAAALGATHAVAQTEQPPPTPQQLFEAGAYQQALAALHEQHEQQPMATADHYLASLVLLRATPPDVDGARAELDAVAADEDEGWKKTADSARALLDGNAQAATDAGMAAVKATPDLLAAQYQLGLARAKAENWAGAAEAFERASQIAPTFAYAHYYAGLAYSRLKRVDREAEHFQLFVKLAPKAPERLAVESILRTIRGR